MQSIVPISLSYLPLYFAFFVATDNLGSFFISNYAIIIDSKGREYMQEWWKKAVAYEIYPSSFYDSNQDGIGDLKGIIEKLDYLEWLGVDLLWITPFFVSPFDDNGYDVKDYLHVDPRFGSDEDFKELLANAHQRGMRIVIDFVLNHTSDEHQWFMDALHGDEKKRDYYIWRKGKKDALGNLCPPNNWSGFFSDSAWARADQSDMYYLKIFSKKMPDLNWENKSLREEMYAIARYWLDQGVDGFRLDAVAHLAKDLSFMDSSVNRNDNGLAEDWSRFSNLPRIHHYLQEFKREVTSHYDCVSIGEVGGGVTPRQALHYVNDRSGTLDMVFNFDAVWVHGSYGSEYQRGELVADVKRLKEVFYMWINNYGEHAWYPVYWMNHDHPRVVSHYGSIKYRKESAKMLATVLLFMGGTPFIYNGEEIGMSNVTYTSLDDFKDVSAQNYIKANQGVKSEAEMLTYLRNASRVNARTPMQWNDQKYAGFSTCQPELKVNDNYREVNVEKQVKDPNSILNYYRKLIKMRKTQFQNTILKGRFDIVDLEHPDVFAYTKETEKQTLLIIANFKGERVKFTFPMEVKNIVTYNYENVHFHGHNIELRPFECVVLEVIRGER